MRWARPKQALAGALAALLLVVALASAPARVARGGALSLLARLTPVAFAAETSKAPIVVEQPLNTTVEEGQSAAFEAAASGAPTPTVQWERSTNGGSTWTNVAGATADRLAIASAKTSESGQEFRATFKNVAGKATSEAATLTVRRAPAVTKQPASKTAEEGASAIFEASASGFPAPTVQWEVSTDGGVAWSPIPGEMSDRLTIEDAGVGEDGYEYRAVFANAAGEARSETATLTVQAPPQVTEQPLGTTVEAGQSVTFEAAASGFPTPAVRWEVSTNGGSSFSAVEGASTDQLTIAETKASESGDEYRVVFTNAAGTATSGVATLTVATTHYSALAWGQNLFRQLGAGTADAFSDVPLSVVGLKFVTAVAAGGTHSLALLANGTVVAWGNNEFGQLGDGSTTIAPVPVAVSGLTGIKAIAAGESHSLALLADGTVMAWGDNEGGQLGDGNDQESEVPVAVKGLSGVRAIAAGGDHSLALMSNGTVMAWGENEAGELGNGGTKSSDVPVAVKGLSHVSGIAAGGEFSLALLGDGAVDGWGSDGSGQIGTGVEEKEEGEGERSEVPIPVEGLSGATAIAAGDDHALALVGGTVIAWGEDSYGELGDGRIVAREPTPVAVGGLSGVVAIAAGGQDSAALLGGGSVMTWGIDRFGELGDGAGGSPSDVPVPVSGIGRVASISAGGFHMLAFGEPKPAISSIGPTFGVAAGQTAVTLTGANFGEATAVHFGANAAVSFEVTSDTTATAVAPAGTGTVDVTITTPAGVSATSAADRYTYVHTPTVTKLSGKSGPVAGHTSVTITGTEFTGVSAVSFGAAGALRFVVESPTSITAEAPPGTAGVVAVTVTNVVGTSATSAKDHFTYKPTVEGVTPNEGPTAGATGVTVTGTGFATAGATTTFKFGTKKATSVQCASATSCTMIAPPGAVGTVNVTAQVNKATSPLNAPADEFTYD